jgi:hypothetical protein
MTEYLLTMTKGEVVIGLMVLLTVVFVVVTPEVRNVVVRLLTNPYERTDGSKIEDTQDKIWFWVLWALMLLIVLGIARVIVEIILWIVMAVLT